MKHSSSSQEQEQQIKESGITVYKVVAVENGAFTSMAMEGMCSATYSQDQVTLPPLPGSPLFAFRTLEVATLEFLRIRDINARYACTAHIRLELWKARTSGEIRGPDRIPRAGAWYSSLSRHAPWGSGFYGCYAFFWKNVSYCLKHCIGKRAGWKIDSATTVCCQDLILLEPLSILKEVSTCL